MALDDSCRLRSAYWNAILAAEDSHDPDKADSITTRHALLHSEVTGDEVLGATSYIRDVAAIMKAWDLFEQMKLNRVTVDGCDCKDSFAPS